MIGIEVPKPRQSKHGPLTRLLSRYGRATPLSEIDDMQWRRSGLTNFPLLLQRDDTYPPV